MTRRSGKSLSVSARYACNRRLRNALYHWAFAALSLDAHCRAHYNRLRKRGHHHARALRGVADRLLAVLIAMLRNGTLYDPQRRRAFCP